MTDRSRLTGWTAAALLGPVAAAVFAGTTVWSAAQAPAAPSSEAAPMAGPVGAGRDPRQVIDDTARIADLEQLVTSLRAQAASLAPNPAGSRPAAVSITNAPAVTPSVRAAAPPPSVARPAARPPAARPPAVHTVTGASSATKGKP
jgi:hypothetical protein